MSKRVEWTLPVELSEEEKAHIANELAVEVRQQAEIENEKKATIADFSDRIKAKDVIIRRLAQIVEAGKDERQVMCQWDYHSPERGKKTLIRQDTFEQVAIFDMNEYDNEAYEAEMQTALPLDA